MREGPVTKISTEKTEMPDSLSGTLPATLGADYADDRALATKAEYDVAQELRVILVQ